MTEKNTKPKKPLYKKWWFWVIIVVIVLIIIGATGSIPEEPNKVTSTDSPNQLEASQEDNKFTVGDTVDMGELLLTVTDVNRNWQSSNEFDTPTNPGDVYVAVSVAIENASEEEVDLASSWNFSLQDANGVIHDTTLGGVGLDKLSSGALAPDGKTTGKILFPVPEDATSELILKYEPFLSFKDPVKIHLQ